MVMRYTQTPTYDSDGNWVGIEQTWTGTVEEIKKEFPGKIVYPEGYLEVWGTPLEKDWYV